MMIKGEYRDVLRKNGTLIEDRGWRSNRIVEDYGKFLAALMKKEDSVIGVGIEYMAVGGGSENQESFKQNVVTFFNSATEEPIEHGDSWVWAKQIEFGDIIYLNPENDKLAGTITNKLQITVTFNIGKPSPKTFIFEQFALLGINGSRDTMFFINFVDHGIISKDAGMKLTRTVRLTFPGGD